MLPTDASRVSSGHAAEYADWGRRVGAAAIDHLPAAVGAGIFGMGYARSLLSAAATRSLEPDWSAGSTPMVVGGIVLLLSLVWAVWNRGVRQGRSGQSLGKRVIRISLRGEETRVPIGTRNALLRDLIHVLDALVLVGYLWPLWEVKRQTLSDKLMRTVVVRQST